MVQDTTYKWFQTREFLSMGPEYSKFQVLKNDELLFEYGITIDNGFVEETQILKVNITNYIFTNELKIQILKGIDTAMKEYIEDFLDFYMIKAVQIAKHTGDVGNDVGFMLNTIFGKPDELNEPMNLEGEQSPDSLLDDFDVISETDLQDTHSKDSQGQEVVLDPTQNKKLEEDKGQINSKVSGQNQSPDINSSNPTPQRTTNPSSIPGLKRTTKSKSATHRKTKIHFR